MKYARIELLWCSVFMRSTYVRVCSVLDYALFSRLQPLYYAISLNKSFDLMQVYHLTWLLSSSIFNYFFECPNTVNLIEKMLCTWLVSSVSYTLMFVKRKFLFFKNMFLCHLTLFIISNIWNKSSIISKIFTINFHHIKPHNKITITTTHSIQYYI